MSRRLHHNDAALNAHLDGALGLIQTDQLMTALQTDTELQHRLSRLNTVRDLVRDAYRTLPTPCSRGAPCHGVQRLLQLRRVYCAPCFQWQMEWKNPTRNPVNRTRPPFCR